MPEEATEALTGWMSAVVESTPTHGWQPRRSEDGDRLGGYAHVMGLRALLGSLAAALGVSRFWSRSNARESYFEPPDYVRMLVISHILELPRDLGIKDGAALVKTGARADSIGDQPVEFFRALLQMPAFDSDEPPTTRLMFRRTNVRVQLPLQAADECFASWVEPLVPPVEWSERQQTLTRTRETGFFAHVTVVGATRFLPIERWPAGRGAQEDLMRSELERALDDLNDYIIALGLVTGDARRRVVALGDLPFLCPVVIEGGR